MTFIAVLLHAFHPALEDRVEALDRVRVNVTAHVFIAVWRTTSWLFGMSRLRKRYCPALPVMILVSVAMFLRKIGSTSLVEVPSLWKLRASPLRETSVRTACLLLAS